MEVLNVILLISQCLPYPACQMCINGRSYRHFMKPFCLFSVREVGRYDAVGSLQTNINSYKKLSISVVKTLMAQTVCLCHQCFLLLVIPASYIIVSIDTGVPCHLRTSIKECFVVSQTRIIVLSSGFCCGLLPEQIPHLWTTCLTLCHPGWSVLATHQCWWMTLWVCLAFIFFPK